MLALILTLMAVTPLEGPTTLDEVRVSGLWFTTEATVLREMPFKVGDEITTEQWQLWENRLWNMGIFSRVDLTMAEEEGRHIAYVKIEDRFPIGPVIRFNFGGGQFFLWAGIADVNLFGRALEVRAFYERFGTQNGFHVHVLDPRLFNKRINGLVEAEWLARPQPEFTVRRAAVRLALDFNAPGFDDDYLRFGARLEGNSDELTETPPYSPPRDSKALFPGLYARFGRLDTDRLRFSKGFVELHADMMITTDPAFPVGAMFTFEGQYFWKLGTRFNVATRLLAGLEKGARPQDRFYLGGLDKVRTYTFSEIRASMYSTANSELRFVAFDSTWVAIMPIAFIDGGVARRDTGEIVPMLSAGLGIRGMIPRLPRFGARFEVGVPFIGTRATDQFRPGINFGIWHYF